MWSLWSSPAAVQENVSEGVFCSNCLYIIWDVFAGYEYKKNMESLTYVAPLPSPSWRTGAGVGSHTLAFVHAHWLTHACSTLVYTFIRITVVWNYQGQSLLFFFTHSFDSVFPCSLQDRSTRCSSYTDLRSYKEDCTQLRNTIKNCCDIRRQCAHGC